ncbi:carboxypeptidase-like regulatory domain-containing protein [Hymenobacter sp. BT683]|uniref:Carboxypeptidase-like regulatory domain-containing protein n=1 Tax=Hymenobacter jeongseonensis TaxID=2791027 RepID=A0ABS0IKZ1_9BACT|nr:carboxypeptidase-like regulatory domain-containing protein [Hymenobacter jeongseonensis]MBF9239042.1 carboxypeptidase-like regulatory domain-containing protein [Hymenobacter jeongseonensis]
MRPSVTLSIPQPCHESWAAMMPTTAGRHCAACQKNVVDFTLKTDAEILAYLAGAANARICGRFAAGQLERPLQRAELAAPTRWRTWLAAAVALWSVRETAGTSALAQTPAEWRAQHSGGPVPATLPPDADNSSITQGTNSALKQQTSIPDSASVPKKYFPAVTTPLLQGIVMDASSGESIPGCTVLIAGTRFGTSTNADGRFELQVPDSLIGTRELTLTIHFVGFVTQQRTRIATNASSIQNFRLQADVKGMLGEVDFVYARKMPPAPWHPRRFYYWSKYWLTQPFRGR